MPLWAMTAVKEQRVSYSPSLTLKSVGFSYTVKTVVVSCRVTEVITTDVIIS